MTATSRATVTSDRCAAVLPCAPAAAVHPQPPPTHAPPPHAAAWQRASTTDSDRCSHQGVKARQPLPSCAAMALRAPYHARSPQVLEVRLGGGERLHDGIAASAWRGAPHVNRQSVMRPCTKTSGVMRPCTKTSGVIWVAQRLVAEGTARPQWTRGLCGTYQSPR